MVLPLYFPGRVFHKHGFIDCLYRFCVGAIHELPLKDPPDSPLLRGTKKDKPICLSLRETFLNIRENPHYPRASAFHSSWKSQNHPGNPGSKSSVSPCLRVSVSPCLRVSVSPWFLYFHLCELCAKLFSSIRINLVNPVNPVKNFLIPYV